SSQVAYLISFPSLLMHHLLSGFNFNKKTRHPAFVLGRMPGAVKSKNARKSLSTIFLETLLKADIS
ncbi:hypothetical protein J7J59_03475, partial [Candidatus Aerophobetes bacterium]|nr:hypothetical protein [Candidatus Aerophobetes bacterium]